MDFDRALLESVVVPERGDGGDVHAGDGGAAEIDGDAVGLTMLEGCKDTLSARHAFRSIMHGGCQLKIFRISNLGSGGSGLRGGFRSRVRDLGRALGFGVACPFDSDLSNLSKSGPLAARPPGLRLALALEIERHCSADEILQSRLIDLVAFVDVDGAPDIPVEAGVE